MVSPVVIVVKGSGRGAGTDWMRKYFTGTPNDINIDIKYVLQLVEAKIGMRLQYTQYMGAYGMQLMILLVRNRYPSTPSSESTLCENSDDYKK